MADDLARRYRGRVIFGPFASAEPDEFVALESEIGHRLPSCFRAFLEVANGGTLEYSFRLPLNAGGEAIGFDDVYRLGRDDHGGYGHGTLLGEYRRRAECWWAAEASVEHLLPIARDGGGDTLYLDLGPESPGRLVAFVHGLPAWTALTRHNVFTVVADDFDAYLDALFVDAEIAEMTWEDVKDTSPTDQWRQAVEAWLDTDLPDWRNSSWAAEPPAQ